MEHIQEELSASYDLEAKLQQELNQTRQQLQELQTENQALEKESIKRVFQERLGANYREADLQQRLAQERKTTENTETALASLQERLSRQQSDFETSHAQVEERVASLREQLEKAQQANKESNTFASVSASNEEEIVKGLLDKLKKSKASNQELTTLRENDRVSTQKRILTLEEQVAKASQSVQSTKEAKTAMESHLEALAQSQHDEFVEETAQQKSSSVESNRQVKELREENQQFTQSQETRNDLSLKIMDSLKTDLLNAQSQPDEAAELKKQLVEERSKTLAMEQEVAALQSQLEQREDTLRRQFLEESQATQDDLFNTRQRHEEVETCHEEVKASKHRVVKQAQQEMGVLQDYLLEKIESLKEQLSLAQSQHDELVESLQKQQCEEMTQQKSSLVESNRQVQELREENQQLVQTETQNDLSLMIIESLKEDLSNAQSQLDEAVHTLKKKLVEESSKMLCKEQEVAALQSQLEQREDTLRRQFLEESPATQDDLFNTRQQLEEVETCLEEVMASKQQVEEQAQQEMGALQDSLLKKMESLKEQRSLAQSQHDEFVESLKKQQGEETAQQKRSLVESNRQVKELREENQQLVQTQETRNDLSLKVMESLKEDLSNAQSQPNEAVDFKKQLVEERSKTLTMEQEVGALQSQLEQRKDTLRRQFLEESQATQDDLFNTRHRLEEVETCLEEVMASKQQVEEQAQQEMGALQDSLLKKMESLKEQHSLAQSQHDEFVESLKKQQGEETAQQKRSWVESNRQVQELREENQQLVQTQEPRNDVSLKIMESLKEDLLNAQSQPDEAVEFKKQLVEERSKILTMEQEVGDLQSQLVQREDTLRRQFLEESQATQDDLFNTRHRLEEVETCLEDVKASKQQFEEQAQQEMGVLQDSLVKKMESLKEERSLGQSQHDEFNESLQKQQGEEMSQHTAMESQLEALKHQVKSQQRKESEEMAQLKTSLEAFKRQVQEIREENQQLMQTQDSREEEAAKKMISLKEQRSLSQSQHDQFVKSLQMQQGEEMAQQNSSLVESNRQVKELREENQQLVQNQVTQNDLSRMIVESLKEDFSNAQSQLDEAVHTLKKQLVEESSKTLCKEQEVTALQSQLEQQEDTILAQQSEVAALQKQLDERIEKSESATKEAADWKKKTEELEGVIRQRQSEDSLKSEATDHESTTATKQLERVKLELEAEKADKQDLVEQSKRDIMQLQESLQQDKRKMNVIHDANQRLIEERNPIQKMVREANAQLQSFERQQLLDAKSREDDMATLRKELEMQMKRAESAALEASELKSKVEEVSAVQKQLSDTERELESTRQDLALTKQQLDEKQTESRDISASKNELVDRTQNEIEQMVMDLKEYKQNVDSKQQDEQDEKPSDDSKDDRPSETKERDVPEDDPTKYDNDRLEKVFRETVEDLESAWGAPLRLSEHVTRDEEERLVAEQLKASTMSEPVEQSGGLAAGVGETSTEGEAAKKPDSSGKKIQGARESIWGLGSKAVAGMFASSSAQPEETPLSPPVQKRRQTQLLKKKMKELHLHVDEDAIDRKNQTQEELVQYIVEQKKKLNEKYKEEMGGAEGNEVSTSGSKAVAGMFASSSAQPKETPLSPPLDVQKRRQTELLKEKMKELHLDIDEDAIDRENQTQEKLVQESVEQKKKQNEKYKEEMEGAEGTEDSTSGSKAVAGLFTSSSTLLEETLSSPPLDVQKQRQLEEKMAELHLDVDEDAITRETEARERLVQGSEEENKKQKENSNEEMEDLEDTDESNTNEEPQPKRNIIINLMVGSVGLLPTWKEPSADDEALEEASPQQSGESTDMPTMESSNGNEKAKVDTVADKEGKQADTGKPASGLFGFFAGSSNETKQRKPTVEKGSDAQTKGADQSDQKDQSQSKEPQEVNSGRQSEDKGAQKVAAGGILSFFLSPKGEQMETKDQAEETPDAAAEDNAREDGTSAQAEKGSESEENLMNGETEDAVAGKQSEPSATDIEDNNVEKQQDLQDQQPSALSKDLDLNQRDSSSVEDTDKGSEETPAEPPGQGLFQQLSDSLFKSAKKRVSEKGAKEKPSQEAVEGSKSGDHGIRGISEVKHQDEQDEKPSDDSKNDRPSGTKETDVPEDHPTKYESESRIKRIEEELSRIIRLTEDELEEELNPEAVEALKMAAPKVAYLKKFYDVFKDEFVYFPPVAKAMIDYSLTEEAEKYYFDEEDEFPMHYTAVLRYAAEVEMGDNDVDYGYMEKLAMDVDLGTSK
jgi:hypothetical protein